MTTRVVHISEPYDIYIGRAGNGADGYLGNPHLLNKPCPLCKGTVHQREDSIKAFESDFAKRIVADPEFQRRVLALKGKRLGCFCKPRYACHGDVYVAWLEGPAASPAPTEPATTPAISEIREFTGEHAWASNFFASPISWQGFAVNTVEHGYQLDKAPKDALGSFPDPAHPGQMIQKSWRHAIAEAPTPGAAKKLGRQAPLRPDWEGRKVKVMAALLKRKFADPVLRAKLLATGDATLVEGNWWNDRFWGVDLRTGEGENMLGRLLMALRTKLRKEPTPAALPAETGPTTAPRPLIKVISGGQTGADQAGLMTAEAFGIPTGGWAPKGWKTSRGPAPALLRDRFHLHEHPADGYPPRTEANAKDADGAIRLAVDFTTAGEQCTLRAIERHRKPSLDIDLKHPRPVEETVRWIRAQNIRILNIAGNREHSQTPGVFKAACFYLRDVFVALGYARVPRA